MASICQCFHWTPEYVMHGISYAALLLIIDGLPRYEKDKGQTKADSKPMTMDDLRTAGIQYMNEGINADNR